MAERPVEIGFLAPLPSGASADRRCEPAASREEPALPMGYHRGAAEFRRQTGYPSQTPSRTQSAVAPATTALPMLSVTLKKTTAMSAAIPAAKGMEAVTTNADPI